MFSQKSLTILILFLSIKIFCLDDYYKILGIARDADKKTIKKAFSDLSRKYHPDKQSSKEDESHYTEIINAYENLKDPQKKSEYDQKLLYGEHDYSDVLFHGRNRKSNYQPNANYYFYGKDGNFYSYHEGESKNYRTHRRDQPIDIVEFLYERILKGWREIDLGLVNFSYKLIEIFFTIISLVVLCILVFLNLFMVDVCEWVKKK